MTFDLYIASARLPDDIVCELFHIAAEIDPPRGPRSHNWQPDDPRGFLGWITLTHVCRAWREVGLSMSRLWARIVSLFPPDIEAILSRAKDTPLALDFTWGNVNGRKFWQLEDTARIISRARTYEDDGPYYPDGKTSQTQDSSFHARAWDGVMDGRTLPLLETLAFCGIASPERVHDTFFAHLSHPLEAPALRRLTLDFAWPIRAPFLRAFYAHGVTWRWQLVIDYLKLFPLLEELKLNLNRVDTQSEQIMAQQSVYKPSLTRLPHLKSLTFVHAGHDSLKVLQHLEYPTSVPVKAETVRNPQVLMPLARSQSADVPRDVMTVAISTHGLHEGRVGITMHAFGTEALPGVAGMALMFADNQVHFGRHDISTMFNIVFEYSAASTLRELVFTKACDCEWHCSEIVTSDNRHVFAECLDRFSNVITFRIHSQTERSFAHIFSLLAERPNLILPALRILDVKLDQTVHEQWWDALHDMLKARAVGGNPITRLIVRGAGACHLFAHHCSEREGTMGRCAAHRRVSLDRERALVREVVDERDDLASTCQCREECGDAAGE
ncbi:hypothetical protein PENSPDRAFT_649093 [Peniophora sp. CONT]|nr:hypothetical protein PENSPDRAFT_649093 [Peniophora sp. CONT]